MGVTSVVMVGGTLFVGSQVYRQNKKKKESPWFALAQKAQNRNRTNNARKKLPFTHSKKGIFSVVASTKATLKKVKGSYLLPWSDDLRHQQRLEIESNSDDLDEMDIAESEKKVNQYFAISSLSLVLASGGVFYPSLNLIALPALAYITVPFVLDGLDSLFRQHRIKMDVIDSIVLPGTIIAGHYFAASLLYWSYYLSRKLLAKTEDHSKKKLSNLFFTQPRLVWVLRDGVEIEIPFESVTVGDVIVIDGGQVIPVDGTIIDGEGSIDQRILTGESQPVEKGVGEQLFASTILLQGKVFLKVEKAGSETVVGEIGEILRRTANFEMSIQSWGEEVADRAALPTLLLSTLALPISGYIGALTVLMGCIGDDMRTLAPLSVLTFLRMTSDLGILVKDGRALEILSQVDTVVFDKTGTLTKELPQVGKIITSHEAYTALEILTYAAAAEHKQTHPIARAIQNEAEQRQLRWPTINSAKYEMGLGVMVELGEKVIRVGSRRFMQRCGITIPGPLKETEDASHSEGHSIVYVAINEQIGGAIELVPTIRPEAKRIIECLQQREMSLAIISGDHEKPTKKLAAMLGIEQYFAETLPAQKADLVAQLQKEGKTVCFVGDGINDSIALKKANVSISLRGASNAATDTAQIILMDESLNQLDTLFELADQLESNLKTGFLTTLIPCFITMAGAFSGHIGLVGSTMLYNIFLIVGGTNSFLPLIQHQNREKGSELES